MAARRPGIPHRTPMKNLLFALSAALLALSASAFSPLQLGVAGRDLQLCAPETPVAGLRLNLPFSENDMAGGLDLGLFSLSGSFTGIRLNAFSWAEAPSGGVTLALFDSCTDYTGVQFAFFGTASGTFTGVQIGAFPYAASLRGAQIGIVNRAGALRGLQLGLLNIVPTPPTAGSPSSASPSEPPARENGPFPFAARNHRLAGRSPCRPVLPFSRKMTPPALFSA